MDTRDPRHINVIVTNEFEGDVKKYLTQIEFDALLLLFAVDPAAGSEHPDYPEIQVLPWHANRLKILYTVLLTEYSAEIVLLAIISAGELARAKDSAADGRIRTSLRQLRNVTAGIGVRELWVWIKNHFPDWFT